MNETQQRILLVDDDEAVLESVRCALLTRGYEVLVARDGLEALACFERDAPDLVVLDIVMPKRSGLNVLDRIHSSHPRSPHVIMVSANDEQRHRDFAFAHGVDAFIAKPFNIDELVSEVDAVLHN